MLTDEEVEEVNKYKYLEFMLSADGGKEEVILAIMNGSKTWTVNGSERRILRVYGMKYFRNI